ncbi:hypothetical protein [Bacillus cereus]|uniref:hypothetical protein n=1 Tax=Bacillus cereus TaxID=1396 RepID=UPI0020D289AF|nr:hypothetical protein [Bacillus cereus]
MFLRPLPNGAYRTALQKAIVKSYIPENSRADTVQYYHQVPHLRRKLKMKRWGFLLLFLLCLGFAFINKSLFFQDKVEIQM